jgi:hypothetical protein
MSTLSRRKPHLTLRCKFMEKSFHEIFSAATGCHLAKPSHNLVAGIVISQQRPSIVMLSSWLCRRTLFTVITTF